MHARVRRVPAERARHPKRLGHVQAGPGPAFPVLAGTAEDAGTTIATTEQSPTSASQIVSTGTPTKQSSSSALPSSLPTQSSSAPSSATTPSTASVAFSATTQPSAVTAPSTSFTTPPTSTSTSPISFTSTPQAHAAARTNSGLSGGAIAGIIAGAVIVGVAFIVFFVRKTYLRRRERKRISWNGAPGLDESSPFPDVSERPASFTSAANTPQRSAPPSFVAYGQSMYSTPVSPIVRMQPPTIPTYAVPTPPTATYNNPIPVVAYPTQPATALAMTRVASVPAQHTPVEAIVKCTFVPTLPDELYIATGERIFIVEQYDDGWNLCANGRGERGMVPRECLERVPSDQSDVGWRNVKRISSLNPDGRRL